MQALVVATQNKLRRAWSAMLDHLRAENGIAAIEAARHHDPAWVLVGLEDAAAKFAAAEHAAYIHAGQVTARWVNTQIRKRAVEKKLAVFDSIDPPAVRWAQENRLRDVAEITTEQRDLIRASLVDAVRGGTNPREWARDLRDSIGLTEYQRGLVENYRREIESGQYGAALERQLSSGHSDRAIASAVRNEVTLTQAQIDTAVERYRANWQAFRAETIARTEGLRVAHQGSEELYRQAVERGDLDAEQIERTWNHSPGRKGSKFERLFHKVMHGQVRGFGEKFVSGLGGELRYPGDPEADSEETISCACALSTRILPDRSGAGGPGGGGEEAEVADEAAIEEEAAVAEEEQAQEIDDEIAAAEVAAADLEYSGLTDQEIEEQHQLIDEQIAALEAERKQLPPRL